MRLLAVLICVAGTAPIAAADPPRAIAPAAARHAPPSTPLSERHTAPPMPVVASTLPAAGRHAEFAALPTAGRHAAFLDEVAHAENTLTAAADRAQHLGSPYRTWLWVTPVLGGGLYGVNFRVDLR